MGNVHHSLFAGRQVAIGEQVPVNVGARLVGRVAGRGVCPIAEQGVEEGKSVGNVVAMQSTVAIRGLYFRDGGDDGRSGTAPRSVMTKLGAF